ncbi:UNVERIFIED_CONTAM: hypothetical protein K2H54_001333 [Gekko kuhli]
MLVQARGKGRMDEKKLQQDQASLGSCKGREDALGVAEQKPSAKIHRQNKNMIHRNLSCGHGNPITEEEPSQEKVAGKATAAQSLLMEEQKQRLKEDRQRDISSRPYKEGGDYSWETNALPFPSERIQDDNKPSVCSSSCCSWETREAGFPAVNRTTAGICGNPGQRASKPPGSRTVENYADIKQPVGKEAPFGNGTERKMAEELYLPCSKRKKRETDGSRPSAENPTKYDLSRHNSGHKFHQDLSFPAGENHSHYNYIEDFLSEGAQVCIGSAQTYVNLEAGTVQTNVEFSVEGGGVVVKHEVEWVTRLEQSHKRK